MNFFFFSSRRRHTRWPRDRSSDVCSSDLAVDRAQLSRRALRQRAARPQPERITGGSLDGGHEVGVLEIVGVIGRHRIGMHGPARARDERAYDAARTLAASLGTIEA